MREAKPVFKPSILIIIFILSFINGTLSFWVGHQQGKSAGNKEGYTKGVEVGLQKYADHVSDILSRDYDFCKKNNDPLVVRRSDHMLVFLCQRGSAYYGYGQPE